MQTASDLISVATAIQQSVAPVFLLTGIGAILSVLASRLARVVDRFRVLVGQPKAQQALPGCYKEKVTLHKRAWWIHRAISLCTISALMVCLVIATLFVGSEINFYHSHIVAFMFIAAMATLILGLLCFLREISMASKTIEMPEKSGEQA